MTDPTPKAPMPTPLSPAAQAVLDAAFSVYDCEALYSLTEGQHAGMIAAAAIRELANQAHPKANIEDIAYTHQNYIDGWKDALDVILDIATELEGK
jgi:hypothetical protein